MDGITLSAVAEVLDLTAAALYRYFPNKGALLAAVNAEILREQRARVQQIGAAARFGGRQDPLVALVAVVEVTILLAERQPDDFALVSLTLVDPRTLVDDMAHAVHIPELMLLLVDLRGWIERAVEDGKLSPGPSEDRAIALIFATLGNLWTRKLNRFADRVDPAALARATARALLMGWGARPEDLDERQSLALRLARSTTLELTP